MKKVYVKVTLSLEIKLEEGVDIQDVIDEMDCEFSSNTENAIIHDWSIEDYTIRS